MKNPLRATLLVSASVFSFTATNEDALAACAPQSGGNDNIVCSGVNGILNHAPGNDTVTATGVTSIGNVLLFVGNDTINFTAAGATVTVLGINMGTAMGDTGTDNVILDNDIITNSILTGEGADTVTLTGTASVGGNVTMDDGADIFSMAGTANVTGNVNTGTGIDDVDLLGGTVGGTVTTGTGADTVLLAGTAITGSLNLGAGADDLIMNSGSANFVDLGDDNNTADFNGGTVNANVTGGLNVDDINLDGTNVLGSVILGQGADILDMTAGTVTGDVHLGVGDDTGTFTGGTISTDLTSADGEDIINLNGTNVGGSVLAGNDNDEVNQTAGTVTGNVNLGAGDDSGTYSGGTITANIQGLAGDDTVNLNGTNVGGNVVTGANNDVVNLTAGTVTGSIQAGTGDDGFSWTGGFVAGFAGGTGSDTADISTVNYNGTQTLDGGDDLSSLDGSTDILTLNMLNVAIDGAVVTNWEQVRANNSIISFSNNAIAVGSDTGDGLFLDNSVLNAPTALAITGNLWLTDSTFNATGPGAGVYSVSGNLSNLGAIDMQESAVGDQLSVGGNYVGGGSLAMDVDTTTNTNDQMAVTGDVTGAPTTLSLNNIGASGSYTGDGPGAGLALVTVGGTTNPANFTLAMGPIFAGAFVYDLDLEADNTWYLQSMVREGALSAIAAGGLAADVGSTFLGTHHERVGEQERNPSSNIWGRMIGKFGKEGVDASGIGEVMTDSNITGLQAGMDLIARENAAGGRTRIGAYGGLAWIDADIATAGAGGVSANSAGDGHVAGLYASHHTETYYVDAVLQGQRVDLNAMGGATTLSTDAEGWLASLEMGHSIALTETSWLEPQAQFIYGQTKTDAATDSDGVVNVWSTDTTMVGRVGARLKSTQKLGDGEGGFVTGWLKANLWSDLKSDDQTLTLYAAAPIALEGKKHWADVGIGFDIQASENIALFVDSDVSFGLKGSYDAFSGKAGIKVMF